MAVTNFSPLLGLALPTTGDLSGTWGTTVNDSITQLLDSAVAGTTTLSVDTDVTLSTTNGAANQARNAVILWTASNGATTRNITAPAQSKAYLVINSGTGSIVIRGAGPTTGVTIPASARALVAWNGSDFVKIVSNPVSLTTDVTGTLPIANGGTGTTSTTFANLTTNVTGTLPIANGGTGTSSTTFANLTTNVTGTLPVGNGGTVATTLTANNVLLGNGTSALQAVAPSTSGNVLTSNGTTWQSTAASAYTQTRSPKTSAYTVVAGDKGNLIDCTSGAFTVGMTAASTLGTSFWFDIANSGSGSILFDAAGADTIDGLANYYLYPGEKRRVFCTSTSAFVSLVMSPFSFTATASGDWIEPPGYKLFQGLLWAAGGGGGRVANASFIGGGGGGGACVPLLRVAASAGSTVSFTLATATTNQTSAAAGASGGNSTFGGVTSYGGGGGYGANGVSGVGGGEELPGVVEV